MGNYEGFIYFIHLILLISSFVLRSSLFLRLQYLLKDIPIAVSPSYGIRVGTVNMLSAHCLGTIILKSSLKSCRHYFFKISTFNVLFMHLKFIYRHVHMHCHKCVIFGPKFYKGIEYFCVGLRILKFQVNRTL